MEYILTKLDRDYYVANLQSNYSDDLGVLLLVRYKEGDFDTVTENNEKMHESLYDLYQTSEHLKDGDTFILNGELVYRCEGVHVVKVD